MASADSARASAGNKRKKAPYVPTPAACAAITACTAALEALSAQDRGHVVARLKSMYFNTSRKGGKPKPRSEVPVLRKLKWRVDFEKSTEWKLRDEWKTENKEFLSSIQDHFNNLTTEEEERYAPYRGIQKDFVSLKKKMQADYYESTGTVKPMPSQKGGKDNKKKAAESSKEPEGGNPLVEPGSEACEALFKKYKTLGTLTASRKRKVSAALAENPAIFRDLPLKRLKRIVNDIIMS